MQEVEGPVRRRQALPGWVRKLATLGVPVALVGELGHHLLQRMGQTLAHHFFHLLFGVGAGVAFTVYVLMDVRRHGWPSFSWRLRPSPPPEGPEAV